jgi:mycothiol synthase
MRVDNVQALGDGQRSEVLVLVANATHVDGTAPLSEAVLLAVRDCHAVRSTTSSPHFLAYVGADLAGYAHLERRPGGVAATAEVVVEPAHRRQGVGTALVHSLETALETAVGPDAGTLRLWSHGHLEAARAFAARDGYSIVRELWSMRRSLRSDADPLPVVHLPEGFATRHFVIGQDEDAWLRVNARAFADHPEQGRLTRHDLDRRIAEPWFDARGFILIEDMRGFAPVLAASHWTKVAPAERPGVPPAEGEVYVVGVDPAYQGLGLGRAVTILGLAHLRERGLTEAMLYVDADNGAAVEIYSRLGFSRFTADVMYSRRSPASATIGG